MEQQKILKFLDWETRNLGQPSYELASAFLEAPDEQALEAKLEEFKQSHDSFFVVAKLPKAHLSKAALLGKLSFYPVECTIEPYINLMKNEQVCLFEKDPTPFIPKRYQKSKIDFEMLEGNFDFPVAKLMSIVEDAYHDDRFHIDHNCPQEVANRRFTFWVQDLVSNPDSYFSVFHVDGEFACLGAFVNDQAILGNVSPKFAKAGLGNYFWLSSFAWIKQHRGYKVCETSISMNNMPVLNLYARLGFKFRGPGYTFHYWHRAE